MTIRWIAATPPIPAVAVAGAGAVGGRLRHGAARRGAAAHVRTAGPWTLALGTPDDLPWADGAIYLGRLPGADSVLVPVHRTPAVAPDLLARRLRELCLPARGPFAVLPDPTGTAVVVVPLDGAL